MNLLKTCLLPALFGVSSLAHAIPFTVFAQANSSSGGSPLPTVNLSAGQSFSVSVNPGDLWSAGPLPRWSNANGLTGNLFATGTDDSGQPANTLIGINFGLHTQNSFSAPFGALVGEINGTFFLIGTSFAGLAPATGVLNLRYWDVNNFDNADSIVANVTVPVPEPATVGLLGLGLVALWGSRRLKK